MDFCCGLHDPWKYIFYPIWNFYVRTEILKQIFQKNPTQPLNGMLSICKLLFPNGSYHIGACRALWGLSFMDDSLQYCSHASCWKTFFSLIKMQMNLIITQPSYGAALFDGRNWELLPIECISEIWPGKLAYTPQIT